MIKDSLIVTLAALANEEPEKSPTEVTLSVGGFLVSGEVISARQYCEAHSLSKNWFHTVHDQQSDGSSENVSSTESESQNDRPNMIHLGNAQFFSGAGNPIPASGMPVRIKIVDVHAISFGRLWPEPKN